MSKFRSKSNYADVYNGNRGGMNLGIDGAVFLKQEATPRLFNAPAIGTQGTSTSGATPSLDISAGSDNKLKVVVDGGTLVDVTLTQAGKTTGALIAAELESKINAALLAGGQDARVWVEFSGGLYVVHSQSTGLASSVVITNGATDNVADDLKLGLANTGVEVVGTDDSDFLLYTSGGPTFSQPIESNAHRSGRFHSGIIKKKKMSEFKLTTYVNMSGTAGASLDTAVKLLWKSLLGSEEVVAATAIRYRQSTPSTFLSLVRVSTIFGEYYNGGYVKDMTLAQPGDGPATCEWSGKASTRVIAGISKVLNPVAASATVVVQAGETDRYDETAPVMVVDTDGRTILYGADGSLTIASITAVTDTLVLSAPITVGANAFIVPWNPGAVQQTGRDNIYTDLLGTLKLKSGGSNICATNIQVAFTNDHVDLDNCFGADHNEGFAAANRMTMVMTVAFDLSNENFAEVVQTTRFAGLSPVLELGAASGRYLKISAPNWIPAVPAIEVPENGVTPVTLEGTLYPSAPGAADPILVEFL